MEMFPLYAMNLLYTIATLGLIVLGLAVVFGFLGVMNMAHGEFIMIGAYSAVFVQQAGYYPLLAIPLAFVVCAIVGWLVEWGIVRHLYRRPFDTLLATWGLAILMRKCIEIAFGRKYRSIDQILPGTVGFAGIDYPSYRLALMVAIALFFAALFIWYRRSNTGARIKAMMSNPELAAAVGIDTARLARGAFVFGTCSAGLAGVLMAPLVRVEPYMGIDYLLSSFFVLVVGGLGSIQGLVTGAAVIGGTNVSISTLSGATGGYLAVLLISIVFLWLKPNGIYSRG